MKTKEIIARDYTVCGRELIALSVAAIAQLGGMFCKGVKCRLISQHEYTAMGYRTENVGYRYTEKGTLVGVIAKIHQSSFKGIDGRTRSADGSISYQTNHGDELNAVGQFIRGEHPEEFEYVHSAPDGSKKLLASPPN